MQKQQDTIKLLILDPSQNNAEELVNLLRNAGRATQAGLVQSPADLGELLNSKTWDICFAQHSATAPSTFDLVAQIKQLEMDIPVVLLCEQQQLDDLVIPSLQAGIRALAPTDNPERMLLAALRELDDLTERRQRRKAEISLRDTEKRCRLLLDSSRDAIAYVHDGMHIYANKAYVDLFGYADLDELEGMSLIDMVTSGDRDNLKTFLRSYSDGKSESDEFSCEGLRDDDSKFAANMHFSSARYEGEPCTQIVILTSSEQAPQTTNQDVVTGLQNFAAFRDLLDRAIEQASQSSVHHAVLYIQLNAFMTLKNSLGTSGINLLVGDVSGVLKNNVARPHVLARIDENGFAVLMYETDSASAAALGEQLCATIDALESSISGERVAVSAGVGIALINETTSNPNDIIKKARQAATFAEKSLESETGNAVQLHSSGSQDAAQAEKIAVLLEKSLEKQLFKLVFQPVVSLRGDSGEHYEVLLRMPDGEGNDISPLDFLSTADNKGLTQQIDRWVISESINRLKVHLDKGHTTHTLIHVSAYTFTDPSILPWIASELNQARMPGNSIIFEISETDATSYTKEAKAFIKGANELQCKTALIHFGRAINPFAALKHLPVSYVKIDGSFITELSKNEETKEELKTLISSLHTQGKLTIAPYVDSASLLPVLWQAGLNYIQGYYIQQPSQDMDYDFSTDDEE